MIDALMILCMLIACLGSRDPLYAVAAGLFSVASSITYVARAKMGDDK